MKNKGQLQTIEAIISISIIGVILILLFSRAPDSQDLTYLNRKIEVYNTLRIIDLTQDLRKHAIDGNSEKIEEMLHHYIKFDFKVAIFNSTTNTTKVPEVDSENLAVVSYLIHGDSFRYNPLEIRVYIW